MSEGKIFIEKRGHKRVFFSCPVKYKLMPKEDNVEAMKKNGKGTDLSAGGVRVEGDFIGDVGNVIKLEITSGTKPDTITAFAEIKWQKKINGCDQFGLEFLAIKDEDREIIEHIIK